MKRGELLSDQRIKKGLSVSALAQTLGVSEAEIERWEAGELPGSEYLLRLSELLEIPVEDILRGGDAQESPVADKMQNGAENGANVAETSENGAEADADSRRFDFGEVRKERGPRELTPENCGEFIRIEIDADEDEPNTYVVSVAARESISNLQLTLRLDFIGYSGAEIFSETVAIQLPQIRKGDTFQQSAPSGEAADYYDYGIVAAEGELR